MPGDQGGGSRSGALHALSAAVVHLTGVSWPAAALPHTAVASVSI